MHVIETRDLVKTYRNQRAVDNFNMQVNSGDIYGFVGKNGAGKSTVMKLIYGLAEPTSGSISLFGNSIAEGGDENRSRIGALINEPGLLLDMSAHENMMAKALAIGIVDAKSRCDEMLGLVNLKNTGRKKVKKFSQGMKQRLGIALTLLGSPDLLLLDEPFNGLDPEATREMRNLIVRLNDMFGMTVVISSHVLDQLDRMATRYGVISHGRMVREMSAEDMRQECGTSLRIRVSEPELVLVMFEEKFTQATIRMDPGEVIHVSGVFDSDAIAQALHAAGAMVLEFTENKRDLEDYFVELMDMGTTC